MDKHKLKQSIDGVINTIPDSRCIANDAKWLGEAKALLAKWNPVIASLQFPDFHSGRHPGLISKKRDALLSLLHEASAELSLETNEAPSILINSGNVFDFFQEVTTILDSAKRDVLFIDPYLDTNFLTRYIPSINNKVKIRILTGKRTNSYKKLEPAVSLYNSQHSTNIEIKGSDKFHDRYLIIDNKVGYQSGGSFKDGASKTPASLTSVKDVLPAVIDIYEKIWSSEAT